MENTQPPPTTGIKGYNKSFRALKTTHRFQLILHVKMGLTMELFMIPF
jgi:hypothetical protein